MKKVNQISAILFFVLTVTFASCGVSARSGRGCGCPMVHKKPVG